MSAICKAYPTHDAAGGAVDALMAIGVPNDLIRVITGARQHDVRKEQVGEFAGTVGPDADRDAGTTHGDGVGRIELTGDHDVERILADSG